MTLIEFLLARVAEDEEKNRHRILFRSRHEGITENRRQAVAVAMRWMDDPGNKRAADQWLRGIAKKYRRHRDYRREWHPD